MKPIIPGQRHSWSVMPGQEHLASAIGNTGVDVVSSPAVISFIEEACHLLLVPYYEGAEATVGTHVDIEHHAPAAIGRVLDCEVELVANDGKRLNFEAQVSQDEKLIMSGWHRRHVIELERFATPDTKPKREPAVAHAPELEFWFDVHSPWCYLASLQIAEIARRHRATLHWRALHLPTLIDTIDGRRSLDENAAFVSWYQQDLQDWAEILGVTLRYHPDYPLRNNRALRACHLSMELGHAASFVPKVMQAYWSDSADISDVSVLSAIGEQAGLGGRRTAQAITDPAYKDAIRRSTEIAIGNGIFGVPTVVSNDKRFFGNDRLALLDRYLSRERSHGV